MISPGTSASFPVPQEWEDEPSAEAVPQARRQVVDIAEIWRSPMSNEALKDAELCAAEVIANAMEHTGSRCRVKVIWTGERLRVEVADSSPQAPDTKSAGDTVTGGRGLLFVEGLSHSWGWYPQGAGKVVWFECAADRLVAGDQRLAVLVDTAT